MCTLWSAEAQDCLFTIPWFSLPAVPCLWVGPIFLPVCHQWLIPTASLCVLFLCHKSLLLIHCWWGQSATSDHCWLTLLGMGSGTQGVAGAEPGEQAESPRAGSCKCVAICTERKWERLGKCGWPSSCQSAKLDCCCAEQAGHSGCAGKCCHLGGNFLFWAF